MLCYNWQLTAKVCFHNFVNIKLISITFIMIRIRFVEVFFKFLNNRIFKFNFFAGKITLKLFCNERGYEKSEFVSPCTGCGSMVDVFKICALHCARFHISLVLVIDQSRVCK